MPQSDTALFQLRYGVESAWGTSPADLIDLRCTGETIQHQKGVVRSAEIRSDRQIPFIAEVSAGMGGAFNYELSYATYDDWIAGAMHDAWLTTTDTPTGDFSSGGKTFTATSASPSFTTKFKVGQWIKIENAVDSGNNGYHRITALSNTVITMGDSTIYDETADAITIKGSVIQNGTTEKSFTVEKYFSDITQYILMKGMEVQSMSMEVRADQIITGSFELLGGSATTRSGSPHDASTTAQNTNDVMNATSNVGTLMMDASALSVKLQAIQLSLGNNLRQRRAIANKYPVAIGRGRCNVTGSVTAYFEDGTLYDKFVNHTALRLHWRVTDSAGNSIFCTLPRLRLISDGTDAPAADQDVLEEMNFEAERDPTSDCMIQFDKFSA